MKNQEPKLLIFSVDKLHRTETENEKNRAFVRENLPVLLEGWGSYEGAKEVSFVVSAKHEKAVQKLCVETKQDCYLYLHGDRTADFLLPNGDEMQKNVGTFKAVSQEVALRERDYSNFKGQYYIID